MRSHDEKKGWTADRFADGTSRRTDYDRQTTSYWIRSFPAILCISLSRFKMVSAVMVKVTHGIPLRPELRLPYNANVAVYDLIAIAAHEGPSATTGHYTAYTKRSGQGATIWAKYNDATVYPLSEKRALAACLTTAYALFYRLRGILATPQDAARSSE
jgi:ubiquitin C-terminal hydrolase